MKKPPLGGFFYFKSQVLVVHTFRFPGIIRVKAKCFHGYVYDTLKQRR